MIRLTPARRSALSRLNAGDDLVYEKGAGWWVGNDRTSGALGLWLIRNCLVSDVGERTECGGMDRYDINETGRRVLASEEKPYRLSDGTWVGTIKEAIAERQSSHD